ncbi:hypothetical protein AWU68_0831 [Corynebacterium simulans]|uniref:Uncharacterized protein n=1 Tax=Corynebacterium simulans TaxID=146827 RepID=A0ABR5VBE9_9CORY|nr:hypothetical protein AWU68_0831 [Corynebacterium simulans]KXU18659.1 hypothetical protein WM41_0623 [Corynebacterium simulans]
MNIFLYAVQRKRLWEDCLKAQRKMNNIHFVLRVTVQESM